MDEPKNISDLEPVLQQAHEWLRVWAAHQRDNVGEMAAELWFATETTLGALSGSTWAKVGEETERDRVEIIEERYGELMASRTLAIQAAIDDLARVDRLGWWAVHRHHRLGNMGMFGMDGIPSWDYYVRALGVLVAPMRKRGVLG